ncbi:MAG: Ig-like domain-containing protein, partial [Rothia sp. (in: high G+C Gram-positive bacteria)]|nr:Ig-like domain-containing protein [Rothia sp. (in: high G+C Gram-positive bacteria)]
MRKQIAAFALTTATIGGLAIGAVPAANADQISNAITNVTTTGDAIVGDNVVLHANWAVPDYSKAGDTFTLELPTELVPLAKNFPLTDEAGNVVANAVVQDGLVTVTLSDFVTTHPINVHGDLTFSVRISSQAVPGKPITLNWGGTATVITPEDDAKPPVAVTEPVKYGWPTDDSQVGWGFDVPGSMDNVVLSDIPKDVKLKCDTLYVGHADQSNGYPTAWTPVDPSQYSVNCSPDGFSLTMNRIEANDLVHVLIYSTPTAGMDQATNTWALSADGEKTGGLAYSAVYEGSGTGAGEAPVVTPSVTPSETPTAGATTPSSVTPPTPVAT